MKIIVDAMGGDKAPFEIVKGAVEAANEFNVNIIFTGDGDKIRETLKGLGENVEKYEIIHTTQVISNNEAPAMAVKTKKDSSMVKGLNLLKAKEADAFISAGSTGAIIAGSMLYVRRIRGINRAAVAPIIPGKKGPFMLIDAGANAECKIINIVQFAQMGSIYMEKIIGKKNPTVALVNIGSEEEKGSTFYKEAHLALKDCGVNFIGNIEGRNIPEGAADVVVCDGFVGNVVLKMYEGVAMYIFNTLKENIMSSTLSKIGGLLLKKTFKNFKKKFDYTEYGGAIFLGVDGPVIKSHGDSNAKAIKNAIKQAVDFVNEDIIGGIKEEISKYSNNEIEE